MNVIFGHVGKLEVHDLRQLVDIQAARGDVGGHQHGDLARLEVVQGARAGVLALVAMNGGGGETVLHELFGQAVGAVLGAGEDEHLVPPAFADDVAQDIALVGLVDHVNGLVHALGRRVARCN